MTNPSTDLDPSHTSAPKRFPLGKLVIGLLLLGALFLLREQAASSLESFIAWVEGLGVWGPIVFIAGYVVATVAFVPGAPLTLAAGPIFGLGAGVAYVFVAASLGAIAAFLVARYGARSWIESKLAHDARFASIDRAIGAEGLKIAFLLRLSPIFPFNLLNYALGLTRVHFSHYAIACVGMLPGTLLYVYLGKIAGDAAAAAGGAAPDAGWQTWAVRILGLVATILVTAVITRTARRALNEATGEPADV